MTESDASQVDDAPRKRGRWKRRLKRLAVVLVVVMALIAYAIKDHVRTLSSLRRVGDTNCYVMDYYVDYHIDEIRTDGIDVNNVEDSFISTLFPEPVASVAVGLKKEFLENDIHATGSDADHCSTVVFRNGRGETFFGRNFDWKHNACLILRIHRDGGVASVAVIDLAYLNLDRPDLDELGFIHRIPLLFAPYYVMDGVNQHGVAIADMALRGSKAPCDEAKPDVIHSTAMRLVLDEAETTQQALEILRRYNIHFVEVGCHYMIADAGGHSAVVEFIGGEMKVTDTAQDWRVCTNHRIWGKSEAQNDASCGRYQHASEQLASMSPAADMDDVMRIMESVSKNDWTMWTSVYNLSTGEFQVVHRKSARPGEHRGRLSDGQ